MTPGFDDKKIAGAILAGGRGERMGSTSKATLMLRGQPLLHHVEGAFAAAGFSTCVVSIKNNADQGLDGEHTIAPDMTCYDGLTSPIVGIISALDWARKNGFSNVLTSPVDTPFIGKAVITRLANTAGTVPCYASCANDQHYLHAIWPTAILGEFSKLFDEENNISVRKVHAQLSSQMITIPPEYAECFTNINTPHDLEHAAKVFAHHPSEQEGP